MFGVSIVLIGIMIAFSALPLVMYVFRSLSVFTIAKRRGIHNYGLAWVPVADAWILGGIADQYDQLFTGRDKKWRVWLLVLNILTFALMLLGIILMISVIFGTALNIGGDFLRNLPHDADAQYFEHYFSNRANAVDWEQAAIMLLGAVVPFMLGSACALAAAVITFIALYKTYKSCHPQTAVVFLVLSIFFEVTIPFFLFAYRNHDDGMIAQAYYPSQNPVQPAAPQTILPPQQ